jgi:hypothetical protein
MFAFTSCIHDDISSDGNCGVELIYHHYQDLGQTVAADELGNAVTNLETYIFDHTGTLIAVDSIRGKLTAGQAATRLKLPDGRYTAVTWANRKVASRIDPGKATLREMRLYLDNPYSYGQDTTGSNPGDDENYKADSDPLYYGYRDFDVGETGKNRVDMNLIMAHCVLNITVRWKDTGLLIEALNKASQKGGTYCYVQLRQVPGRMGFEPSYMIRNNIAEECNPPAYNSDMAETPVNFIPTIEDRLSPVDHRAYAILLGSTLTARLVTYRLTDKCHPMLGIYKGDTPLFPDGKVEIDLEKFFRQSDIDLISTANMNYNLEIEIDGDRIAVSNRYDMLDWQEGGSIGDGNW